MEKPVLLLDTSTERGVVAIVSDREVLFQKELFSKAPSSILVPTVKEGLDALSLEPSDISYVGVGIGPGSYTGIRVAVAVAKSFVFARKIPLVGFSSLVGFIPHEEGPFAAIIDAKIGGVYLLLGEKKEEKISYFSEPALVSLDDLNLKGIKTLVTPSRKPLEKKLNRNDFNWVERGPGIHQLALIADEKYIKGEFSLDSHLELMYLRKSQPEGLKA